MQQCPPTEGNPLPGFAAKGKVNDRIPVPVDRAVAAEVDDGPEAKRRFSPVMLHIGSSSVRYKYEVVLQELRGWLSKRGAERICDPRRQRFSDWTVFRLAAPCD